MRQAVLEALRQLGHRRVGSDGTRGRWASLPRVPPGPRHPHEEEVLLATHKLQQAEDDVRLRDGVEHAFLPFAPTGSGAGRYIVVQKVSNTAMRYRSHAEIKKTSVPEKNTAFHEELGAPLSAFLVLTGGGRSQCLRGVYQHRRPLDADVRGAPRLRKSTDEATA